jgi:hypothetical protein
MNPHPSKDEPPANSSSESPGDWSRRPPILRASAWLVENFGYGLSDGGCLIFARAAQELFPNSALATILRDNRPDHYGIMLEDGRLADAEGVYSSGSAWVECFRSREILPRDCRLCVAAEFVPSEEIPDSPAASKKLAGLLAGLSCSPGDCQPAPSSNPSPSLSRRPSSPTAPDKSSSRWRDQFSRSI